MQNDSVPILFEELSAARKSLRIAVVTETYPPEVNGVAMSCSRAVEGLLQRSHQIQLIRPRQDDTDRGDANGRLQQVLMRGLAIPRYPDLKMGLPARRALANLWTYHRPDLVHIVTEGPLGWSALQAALKLRLPVCSDFRTNFHAYSRHYGVGWLSKPILGYLRKFHNRTALTMVPTEAMRAELSRAGFRNVNVVSRGVDTRLFDPARRSEALRTKWGAAPGDPVVLHVGRLAPEKNLPALIDAFEELQGRAPRAKLVLVGDGPARGSLQARLPDAVYAGMRRGDDLAAHYASGDIFLFPSLTETYGNVTLEALASGLAVVAFDYAAAAEHIRHDHNGILANYGDASAFAARAGALAADPVRIRDLGARARQTSLGLDWTRIVQRLESLFIAVTGTAASLPPAATPRQLTGTAS